MGSIICLDVDGVLRPFVGESIRVFYKYHPELTVRPYSETKGDFWSRFPKPEAYMHNFILETHAKDVFYDALPYKGAVDGFNKLNEYCNNTDKILMIVSSQYSYLLKLYTIQWLERLNMLTERLCFLPHGEKHIVDGDVLIDDDIRNLKNWESNGQLPLCFNRQWNQDWKGLRINDLQEVPELLESLE